MTSPDDLYQMSVTILRDILNGPEPVSMKEQRARLRFVEVYARGSGESLDALLAHANLRPPEGAEEANSDAGVVLRKAPSWLAPKPDEDPPSIADVTADLYQELS